MNFKEKKIKENDEDIGKLNTLFSNLQVNNYTKSIKEDNGNQKLVINLVSLNSILDMIFKKCFSKIMSNPFY